MASGERFTGWHFLGKGGTADVYRCTDERLQREVAVKLLLDEYTDNPIVQETLRTEVLIARDLPAHPNIASVYDFYDGPHPVHGRDSVGTVMEFISGVELKQWMDVNKGRLVATAPERFEVFRLLMQALAHIHQHTIHRDLKPANIMLVGGDIAQPKIMDFGFARPHEEAGEEGFRVGTPRYMSQEQYLTPDKVDQRSDVYTMGVIGYELFSDFRAPPTSLRRVKGPEDVKPVAPGAIRRPSSYCFVVPPALDQVLLQMLSFDPAERPQSAAEVMAVLDAVALLDPDSVTSDDDAARVRDDAIEIPGGIMRIGATSGVDNPNEKPNVRVEISSFHLDEHPVTNAAYRAYINATGVEAPPFLDHEELGRHDQPVVGVTWDEARRFAKWVGGHLPSEAQWEYAASGGALNDPQSDHRRPNKYPWGEDEPTPTLANLDGAQGATSSVGSFPAGNVPRFGLQDMCGNVWEWCEDAWSPSYYQTLKHGVRIPVCEAEGDDRTIRGGAFDSFAFQGRCAFRRNAPRDERAPNIGFRVAYGSAEE